MNLGALLPLLKLFQDSGVIGKVQPVEYTITQPVVLGEISDEEIALAYIEEGKGLPPERIGVKLKTGRF